MAGERTGSAAVIPSMGCTRAVRLTDGVGPFTAELYALNMDARHPSVDEKGI